MRHPISGKQKTARPYMIKKYIWHFLEPLINDKRLEPVLMILGTLAVVGGILYTLLQFILG